MDDGHILPCAPLGRCALHDVVTDRDDHIRPVEELVDIVFLRDADGPEAVFVIHRDDALGHHSVDHRDVQAVSQLGDRSSGMAAHGTRACKDDRIFRLTDDFSCRCNVGRVGIDLMHLLALERHGVGGHFCNILGQVDMGRARLALFGVLEGQPHDLAHRVGADDLLRALGDRLKHRGQVKVLVAGELHPVGADLARDGHQRRTVQISIRHTGDKVGGTGAKGGQADAGPAGQTAIDIRHKGRTLLVAHRDEAYLAVLNRKHQIQRLFARNAKHHINALSLQTVHQHLRSRFHFLHFLSLPKRKRQRSPMRATLPLLRLL